MSVLPDPASAAGLRKVLFLAGHKSHGEGEHEHAAGSLFLRDALNRSKTDVWAQVHSQWPTDPRAFDSVAAVVVYGDGQGSHLLNGHWAFMDSLNRRGVGLALFHWTVQPDPGAPQSYALSMLGGVFESYYSVNPTWTPIFDPMPAHPASAGVLPVAEEDEWYFHMRFRPNATGVTPLLITRPPLSWVETLGRGGEYGLNDFVLADVKAGLPQPVAWVAENGGTRGRGFGFTGGHFHRNWGTEFHQRLVLNCLAWIAQGSIPAGGMPVLKPTTAELNAYMKMAIPSLEKQLPPSTATSINSSGHRAQQRQRLRHAPSRDRDWVGRKSPLGSPARD